MNSTQTRMGYAVVRIAQCVVSIHRVANQFLTLLPGIQLDILENLSHFGFSPSMISSISCRWNI